MKSFAIVTSLLFFSSIVPAHAESLPVIQHKASCTLSKISSAGSKTPIQQNHFDFDFSTDPSVPAAPIRGSFGKFNYLITVDTQNAAAGALSLEMTITAANGAVAKSGTDIMGYYDGSSKVTAARVELGHNGMTTGLICYISQKN